MPISTDDELNAAHSTTLGLGSTNLGPPSANFDQTLPGIDQPWPELYHSCPNSANCVPTSTKLGSWSAKLDRTLLVSTKSRAGIHIKSGPTSFNLGPPSTKFDQIGLETDHTWLGKDHLDHFDQTWPGTKVQVGSVPGVVSQFRTCSVSVGPHFDAKVMLHQSLRDRFQRPQTSAHFTSDVPGGGG